VSEQEALGMSSGWTKGEYVGFLPFAAANVLVATGRYQFWQASFWGYTVKRVSKPEEDGEQ